MPQAEKVPVLSTVPIMLRLTVALVTSLPVKVEVEMPVRPSEMPKTSGELVWLMPLTVFWVICMLFSKPTRMPVFATLFGEAVLMRVCVVGLPVFLLPAFAPCEKMPNCVLLRLLFWMVLLLLFVPVLDVLIVLLPEPMPNNVCVLPLPATFRFLIVLLVAPSVPLLCIQTTADDVPVLVLVIVRLRSVPVPPIEPSIVTRSAAFKRINAPLLVPEIARAAPV